MRRIAALLALAALAGCGSGGANPIVQEAWDEVQGFWTNEPADPPAGRRRVRSRGPTSRRRT